MPWQSRRSQAFLCAALRARAGINTPSWPPIHPAWLRCSSSITPVFSVVAPCQAVASTPKMAYLFLRRPLVWGSSSRPPVDEIHSVRATEPARNGVVILPLTCPNCGNSENFLVKTLQMHLLRVADTQFQPPQEEGRPALVELLCDECDSSLDLDTLDDGTQRELRLTLGAR